MLEHGVCLPQETLIVLVAFKSLQLPSNVGLPCSQTVRLPNQNENWINFRQAAIFILLYIACCTQLSAQSVSDPLILERRLVSDETFYLSDTKPWPPSRNLYPSKPHYLRFGSLQRSGSFTRLSHSGAERRVCLPALQPSRFWEMRI